MCKGQAGLTITPGICMFYAMMIIYFRCKAGANLVLVPGCKADILPGHKVATTPTTRQQADAAHLQSRKRSPQPRPVEKCVKFLEISMGCHGMPWNAMGEQLPSGERLHNYGKSSFLMGKITIKGNFQ